MEFLKCSLGGISYGSGETEIDLVNKALKEGRDVATVTPKKKTGFSFEDDTFFKNLRGGHETTPVIREAMLLLSVCHTVIPEEDKDDPSGNQV
jgi:phospholipid-transporting ATPase